MTARPGRRVVAPEADAAAGRRTVWLLGFVSFATDFASSLITPVLPLFVVVALGAGFGELGLFVALATLASHSLRWFAGRWADRFGRSLPFLFLGYGLSAIAKPLFGVAASWQQVAAIRVAERCGKALRAAPRDRLLGRSGGGRTAGRRFGLHKALDMAGETSGVLCLLLLLHLWGDDEASLRRIFHLALWPGLLAMGLLTLVREGPVDAEPLEVRSSEPEPRGGDRAPAAAPLDPELRRALLAYTVYGGLLVNESFFLVRAEQVGLPLRLVPLLALLLAASQALAGVPLGRFVDRVGSTAVLHLSFGCGIVAMALLAVPSPGAALLAAVPLGLQLTASVTAMRALIAARARKAGTVFGQLHAAAALATAAGAVVFGLLWERLGFAAVAAVSVAGTSSVLGIALLLERRRRARDPGPSAR